MSGPCFAHFQYNCKICFPSPAAKNPSSGGTDATAITATAPAAPGKDDDSGTTTVPVTTTAPGTAFPSGTAATPGTVTEVSLDQPAIDPGSSEEGLKRKQLAVEFRPLKRKKKTIIDCPIVQQIFRRDLSLTNKFFNSGKVLAWVLQPEDEAFRMIHEYVANGQVHDFGIKVCSIIRVVAKAKGLEEVDDDRLDFNDDPETRDKFRMMLWHGTKKKAVSSILENGLRLPTPHYQMFGAGIYFADRVSKSCQYTGYSLPGRKYFLFLCDVLLGNVHESIQPMNHITSPPPTTQSGRLPIVNDSVKGPGIHIPDPEGNKTHEGCVWPLGATVTNANRDPRNPLMLNFNEYIVYKTEQVQPKYLVKVEIMEKAYFEKLS